MFCVGFDFLDGDVMWVLNFMNNLYNEAFAWVDTLWGGVSNVIVHETYIVEIVCEGECVGGKMFSCFIASKSV